MCVWGEKKTHFQDVPPVFKENNLQYYQNIYKFVKHCFEMFGPKLINVFYNMYVFTV